MRLEELSVPKDPLLSLTAGYNGGIFNGPQFGRNWVDTPEYGVPFLGSSSMLLADLSNVPLLRRRDAESSKLSYLRISPGTTLISCSGTIGRMVYTRPDMAGMWTSQHIMKVVPDPDRIPPGYLYAFLSGKFGVPLVTSSTYGAIIQHIEAPHLANLPVPRLGDAIESRAGELVQRAADARSEASRILEHAQAEIRRMFPAKEGAGTRLWAGVSASRVRARLDAYYYSERCMAARRAFEGAADEQRRLVDVADVFIPGIFKRRYAPDPNFGIPYITGGDVFNLAPESDRYLMTLVAERYQLVVSKGTILIQEAGQLGGLIGRSVLVGDYLDGFAVSNNMVRVIPRDNGDTGYLLALLSTPEGVLLVSREAAGSSIPHLEVGRVADIKVPWPERELRQRIGHRVLQAQELRDQACADEAHARQLVEDAIEGR
jgi:type I restriction enzyme S subunit